MEFIWKGLTEKMNLRQSLKSTIGVVVVDEGARVGESCARWEAEGGKFNARESDDGGP